MRQVVVALIAAGILLAAGCSVAGQATGSGPRYSPQAAAQKACDQYCDSLAELDSRRCDYKTDPIGCADLLTSKTSLAWKISTALENRDDSGSVWPAGPEVEEIERAIRRTTEGDFASMRCYVPTTDEASVRNCGIAAFSKEYGFEDLRILLPQLAGR